MALVARKPSLRNSAGKVLVDVWVIRRPSLLMFLIQNKIWNNWNKHYIIAPSINYWNLQFTNSSETFAALIFKCLSKMSIGGRYGTSLETLSGCQRRVRIHGWHRKKSSPTPNFQSKAVSVANLPKWAQIWISTPFSPLPSKEFVLWPAF